jgi:hypothetical protein
MFFIFIWGKIDLEENEISFLSICFLICESVANYFVVILFLVLLVKTNRYENYSFRRKSK